MYWVKNFNNNFKSVTVEIFVNSRILIEIPWWFHTNYNQYIFGADTIYAVIIWKYLVLKATFYWFDVIGNNMGGIAWRR